MKKPSTLPSELHEYRERHGLSTAQMAQQSNVPEHDYKRVESGNGELSSEEEKKYWKLLAILKLGPPKKQQFSRAWHLLIPILICSTFIIIFSQSEGYRAGAQTGESDASMKGFIVVSVIFCTCYWYVWTPELPFKSRRNQKNSGK